MVFAGLKARTTSGCEGRTTTAGVMQAFRPARHSWTTFGGPRLGRQDDLVALFQSFEHLDLRAVAHAELDGRFLPAVLRTRQDEFDRRPLRGVVADGGLRNE